MHQHRSSPRDSNQSTLPMNEKHICSMEPSCAHVVETLTGHLNGTRAQQRADHFRTIRVAITPRLDCTHLTAVAQELRSHVGILPPDHLHLPQIMGVVEGHLRHRSADANERAHAGSSARLEARRRRERVTDGRGAPQGANGPLIQPGAGLGPTKSPGKTRRFDAKAIRSDAVRHGLT